MILPHVFAALLYVIRETENDDLTGVMQKLIYTYGEDIIPIAVEITQHLVSTVTCDFKAQGPYAQKS